MNHPPREEWTDFLHDDLAPDRRRELRTHLGECAECRAQVETWRSVQHELRGWRIPEARAHAAPARSWPFMKLAAAAVVMIAAGYALARWTAPVADTAAIRAALTADLRAELARFAAENSARQQEYQAAFTKALGRLEAQRLVEYADLRRDVETVAVRAEGELETTRQNLFRLASIER
jgi:hypothetical protein